MRWNYSRIFLLRPVAGWMERNLLVFVAGLPFRLSTAVGARQTLALARNSSHLPPSRARRGNGRDTLATLLDWEQVCALTHTVRGCLVLSLSLEGIRSTATATSAGQVSLVEAVVSTICTSMPLFCYGVILILGLEWSQRDKLLIAIAVGRQQHLGKYTACLRRACVAR